MFCLHLCFSFYSRAREEREEARCDRRMNGAPLRHVVSIKKRACHHKVSLPSLSCAATSLFQQSWASRCFRLYFQWSWASRGFRRCSQQLCSLVVMAKAVTHKFVISMVEDSLHLDSPLIELKIEEEAAALLHKKPQPCFNFQCRNLFSTTSG